MSDQDTEHNTLVFTTAESLHARLREACKIAGMNPAEIELACMVGTLDSLQCMTRFFHGKPHAPAGPSETIERLVPILYGGVQGYLQAKAEIVGEQPYVLTKETSC